MEVIGGRLFTTVRDALGLTYDCNFQLAFGLQNSDATTYRLVVTSTPAKIDEALAAALRVGTHEQCMPCHQRHCRPSFPALNGIVRRGEHCPSVPWIVHATSASALCSLVS